MTILETIFKLFKESGLYYSYTQEQQDVVEEICTIHTKCNTIGGSYTSDITSLLNELEKKVSRKVLSSSISPIKLLELLKTDHIKPGDLEVINVIEDIEDEKLREEFLNLLVDKVDLLLIADRNQLRYFPDNALSHLNNDMLDKIIKVKNECNNK